MSQRFTPVDREVPQMLNDPDRGAPSLTEGPPIEFKASAPRKAIGTLARRGGGWWGPPLWIQAKERTWTPLSPTVYVRVGWAEGGPHRETEPLWSNLTLKKQHTHRGKNAGATAGGHHEGPPTGPDDHQNSEQDQGSGPLPH
ncbi:hypothetical protein NDU88_003302 [Pleurodeles waltl]|uniref:Uncharacterized protein n=1 Tax=Pleurodeles waltl TaxID=8319 RepID=A0AAV7WUZ0_PLEWA|nr:hypothetical protein NDU88_003302 [Pleurodeles waltl]